jgi:hypothetical protein
MCRANVKLWRHYWENQSTQAFVTELSAVIGIPLMELVQTRQGGNPQLQGTWVHRRVALDLARWLSPQFMAQAALRTADGNLGYYTVKGFANRFGLCQRFWSLPSLYQTIAAY